MMDDQPGDQARRPTDEPTPLWEVRGGWPRDLLTWITAVPPLLYLGLVAAGFTGFATFVVLLVVSWSPSLATVLGTAVSLVTWVWWARQHFGAHGEVVRFYRDHVVADLRPKRGGRLVRGPLRRYRFGYDQIGTLVLRPADTTIAIRFALPDPDRRSSLEIRLPRLELRDRFDEILEWIDEVAPDHLFYLATDTEAHYSRPCTAPDLLPTRRLVRGPVTMRPSPVLEPSGEAAITADGERYRLHFQGFATSWLTRTGEPPATVLAAWVEFDRARPVVRIHAGHGLPIGWFPLQPTGDRLVLQFGWDDCLTWDLVDGSLRSTSGTDERRIGSLCQTGDAAELHLDQECAVELALVTCLLAGFLPRHGERHGRPLQLPAQPGEQAVEPVDDRPGKVPGEQLPPVGP